ncbi:MAG TPA: CoA-transferase [Ignavibacteriales bacterium]|nr:CoA-transferase [Ignavibacteriales bacterium]
MEQELKNGIGEIFTDVDPEHSREYFRKKNKKMVPKLSTVTEVVEKYVQDGTYIAVGGFGGVRIPTAILHEIVRQRKKNLGFSGHVATHDCQILAAGECYNRVDIAYVVGLEARGLSKNSRRVFESGKLKITEWSNAALSWRYKAAAMGLPFLPTRTMLGTDTYKYSAAKEITCPFTGKKLAALPALYPDVAFIHVHRCDIYGNAQIDGIIVADDDIAKAAKHVIITTEKIISNDEIRREPNRTIIPYWLVDAVIEIPYGSYPGNMPGEYYSDEEHLMEWLNAEQDPEKFKEFLDKYIYNTKDFYEYLQLNGGIEKMIKLRQKELLIG